ncbi:MAG: hypothetical protein V2A34_07485 [Lentisphaerota bacterium]
MNDHADKKNVQAVPACKRHGCLGCLGRGAMAGGEFNVESGPGKGTTSVGRGSPRVAPTKWVTPPRVSAPGGGNS